MFSSLCSLRSTQCATLIALATAAGISRTEQTQSARTADQDRAVTTCRVVEANPSLSRISGYRFELSAPAPWLRSSVSFNIGRISSDVAEALSRGSSNSLAQLCVFAPEPTPLPRPSVFSPSLLFLAETAFSLTTSDHSLPFAVGPPPRGMTSTLFRVDGAFAPGDSTARRRQVSRVAIVFCSFFAALIAPVESRPFAGRTVFPPSFALRGEPEFVCRQFQAAAARAQLGDIFSAPFRQNPTSDFS